MSTSHRLTITLDADQYEQVSRLAKLEERSLSWTVRKAVQEYLRKRRVMEQLELPTARKGGR